MITATELVAYLHMGAVVWEQLPPKHLPFPSYHMEVDLDGDKIPIAITLEAVVTAYLTNQIVETGPPDDLGRLYYILKGEHDDHQQARDIGEPSHL